MNQTGSETEVIGSKQSLHVPMEERRRWGEEEEGNIGAPLSLASTIKISTLFI